MGWKEFALYLPRVFAVRLFMGNVKKNNKKTPLKQQTARMEARPSPHQRPHFLKSPSPPHGAHAVTVSLNPMSLTPA